jgi:dipeptidyl aminopeptidase/acylaminoacyl peptidase
MTAVSLITRRALFGNPDRAFALISPDGRRLASLAPVDGVMNIIVTPVDTPTAASPVTRETGRGIGHCAWAHDGASLVYLSDRDGDEQWHLYRVRMDDGDVLDLTPGEGRARMLELSPRYPDEVLVEIQAADPATAGRFRINLHDGVRTRLPAMPDFQRLLWSDFRPWLGVRSRPEGASEWYRPVGDDWQPWLQVPAVDDMSTFPLAEAGDGRIYLVDSRDRDTAALCRIDPASGVRQVLFADPCADVSDVLLDTRSRQPVAAAVTWLRKDWHTLDAGVAAEFDYLHGRCHGDITLASRTPDDQHWIIGYQADTTPTRFYHYDRRQGEARYLFNNSERLEALPLLPMQALTLAARDGLALTAYLTLPDSALRPLPLMLLVHGGPWERDQWGFQPWHQWLANRGYAVLSVNFRGSSGFGKSFLNAGDREWGRAMQHDLLDAVDWAVNEGIADPERVGIMGSSYGGYATLAGLAFSPERFACGIDLMGPSHLVSLLESVPPQWQSQIELFKQRVGDHTTDEGRQWLEACSPLLHAKHIRKPLLISQGAHDPRVPRVESDRMVAALRARGIPVIYLLFPDEGHGLARPSNRLALCAIAEAFLGLHLGGAVEPPGEDLAGSSVQILSGAEYLPGSFAIHANRS